MTLKGTLKENLFWHIRPFYVMWRLRVIKKEKILSTSHNFFTLKKYGGNK